ncbi:MAG: transporter substrate-binding domain-containing protein [Bacteroidota bacterium]
MKKNSHSYSIIGLIILLAFPAVLSCRKQEIAMVEEEKFERDLDEIRKSGKMIVVTDFNSINYFIYKGQPLGFQYEMLQELSDHLDLEIEVRVNNDLDKNFNDLVQGKVDLIASNLTVSRERKEIAAFTVPHSQTRQVLVQKKLQGQKPFAEVRELIRNPLNLYGKTVYVQRNSSHATRLKNLEEEIGEEINIIEVPIETEQLIRMVARGEIDYTIADEDVARVNGSYFPNLDVETVISFSQNQAWALRENSLQLKREIDLWLEDFKQTRTYAILYNKYFKSKRMAGIVKSDYYYPETGRISPYDEVFKTEAEKIGWDWRLIASMVYQESRFNPLAVSWAGAFGLMQLMPGTAARFGVNQNSSATAQIRAGIRFIHWLDMQLDDYIEDESERIKFILASYNVGLGHVLDAMRLAEKYDKDPKIWEDNVDFFLLKKADPQFFTDPVVRNGYARGAETYKYVRDIMYRYHHYRNININQTTDLAQSLQ